MNRGSRLIALLSVLVLLLTACGGSDDTDDETGAVDDSATEDGGDPTDEPVASTDDSQGDDESEGADDSQEEGPSDATASSDSVLRYAVPGVAQSMDPRSANEFQQIFLEQVYEPLIRTTPEGDYEPGLAIEWGLVDDGATFELVLREGVTFQDGEPFDAEAVVANLEASAAEGSNLATELSVVDSVEAVDEFTVRVALNGPGGHMAGVLAGYPGMMVSPAAFDTDLQLNPVGAGPFTLTDIGETAVNFEAWDGYYAADEVLIGGLELSTFADESARLRALQSGQLDAAFVSPSQVAEAESVGLEVSAIDQTSFHGVLFNTAHEALGQDLVRQALMMAVDRDAISQALYDGLCTPTVQPYPSNYWAHVPELDGAGTYDVDAARALMEEAGYADGFSLTISTGSITIYQSLAEVLQQQLAELGIEAEVEVSTTLSEERRNGDFDMIVGAFQSGRPDPTVFAANYYLPDGPLNFGGVEFAGVAELIEESRQTTDTSERAASIAGIVEQTVEQGPTLMPICIPGSIVAEREGVDGIVTSVLANRDFRHATVPS